MMACQALREIRGAVGEILRGAEEADSAKSRIKKVKRRRAGLGMASPQVGAICSG